MGAEIQTDEPDKLPVTDGSVRHLVMAGRGRDLAGWEKSV
jgi:hypothetical protein